VLVALRTPHCFARASEPRAAETHGRAQFVAGMTAPSDDALPPLRGRALLDWALQPLLGGDAAAAAATQNERSWNRLARVLRDGGLAGAGLPAAVWKAVATACDAPAAAGDALPSSAREVLVTARQRRGSCLNARLEPPETVAAAAARALRRATSPGATAAWRALTSEVLVTLQHAAQAAPNARKVRRRCVCHGVVPPHAKGTQTCALLVETALPEFAVAYYALRASDSVEDAELLLTLEATLSAAFFHASLVNGHLLAAYSVAASTAPSAVPDAEQPARKRQKTTVQQADGVVVPPSSPQAALYYLVCSRVQSGMFPSCVSPATFVP